MKTLIFFFSALLMCSQDAISQSTEIGIFGGPNLNQLRGNDYMDDAHKSLVAFSCGAMLRVPIKSELNFLATLQFERNGSKIPDLIFTDPFGNNMGKADLYNHLDFIVLPVMAEYVSGSRIQLSLYGGPFVGYLINQRYVIKWGEGPWDDEKGPSNSWDLNKINFGLSAGAGIKLPLYKKLHLELRLENHLGLVNLNHSDVINGKVRTNSTNFTIGVGLPLK